MSSFFTLTAPQKLTLSVLGAAFLGLSTGNAAQAADLFNNNAPDLQNAVRSDFSFPVEAGDNFRFDTSNDIRSITWSGIYANSTSLLPADAPAADNFSIRIFSFIQDPQGIETPATDPLVALKPVTLERISSGKSIQDQYEIYSYTFNLAAPFGLKSGDYLLSIVNDTTASADDWFWATSSQIGNNLGRCKTVFGVCQPNTSQSIDPRWFRDRNAVELSFAIEGNVTPAPPTSPPAPVPPKPVPTPALLPGLIGFGLSLWRKRRSTGTARSTQIN